MWSKRFAVVVLMAGLGAGVAAGAESVGVLLRKGIYQEETVGDLDAAMKIYQGIVANEKANRPHVAQAKFRLGMCHVKKGEKEKAFGMFAGLIKEFPGQAKLVEQARGRLAALGHVPESEEPAGIELQEIWPFPGLGDLDVLAISRDGRYCAFIDSKSGDLVVRDLTTGEDQPPIEVLAGDISASISPDNKWVAYTVRNVKEGRYELCIAGIDGSQKRVLYPNEENSRIELRGWSPDSQHVLTTFFDTGGEKVSVNEVPARIATVAIADGSTRVLKVLAPEEHNRYPMPGSSPDGRYVAYDRVVDTASRQADIFLIPLDHGPEIHLVESPANDAVFGWLPDGKDFLFRRGQDVWMIQVVDGKPQGVPRLVRKGLPFRQARYCHDLVRTPTGGWAFYYRERLANRYLSGIYLAALEPDAGKLLKDWTPVVETLGQGVLPDFPQAGWALSPDFSHDGKYLAYYVAPGSQQSPKFGIGPGKIVIRSLETGQEREIILSPKFGTQGGSAWLRWAPDGRSILVLGCTEELSRGIFRVDIDSGKLTPVVLEPEQTITDWKLFHTEGRVEGDSIGRGELSPDGKTLFFIRGHFDPNAPRGRQRARLRIVARDVETD